MAVLGCAQDYQIVIATGEGLVIGQLSPSEVTWGRVIDDISAASVTIPISDASCCDILGKIHVWRHWMQIFRAGEYVWGGPIVQVAGGRTQVQIFAKDIFALMQKRIVHEELCFAADCGGLPFDLADIGTILVNDAFYEGTPPYSVQAVATGIVGEREYKPGENSFSALQEALQVGLDATVLGSKIILGKANGLAPFGTTATLTCDDFLGDIETEEDGDNLATRVIVLGTGFVGVALAPNTNAFGVNSYYGLIEYVDSSQSSLASQAAVDQAAQALIAAKYPAPVTLVAPSGAALSASAPIPISQLVPGAYTTIIADCLCRPVTAVLVLLSINVQWTAAGEVVNVSYGTVGSINDGGQ